MPYCQQCGTEVGELASTCPTCSARVKRPEVHVVNGKSVYDSGHPGWLLLGCCLPIVGLILFIVWNKEKPETAKMLIIGAIIGFILGGGGLIGLS